MVNAFTRSIKLFTSSALSPETRALALAALARNDVARLIATGQASPMYTRYVDGTQGAAEETVKPEGRISYFFEYLTDVIPEAIKFLRANSPVLTGAYRDSFYVAVGNRRILAQDFDTRLILGETTVYIYNSVPYSRKVDVQLVGYKPLHFSDGYHIFANCSQMLMSKYGNTISVQRIYDVSFPGKYALQRTQMRPKPRSHTVLRSKGDLVESPGLVITTRGG